MTVKIPYHARLVQYQMAGEATDSNAGLPGLARTGGWRPGSDTDVFDILYE